MKASQLQLYIYIGLLFLARPFFWKVDKSFPLFQLQKLKYQMCIRFLKYTQPLPPRVYFCCSHAEKDKIQPTVIRNHLGLPSVCPQAYQSISSFQQQGTLESLPFLRQSLQPLAHPGPFKEPHVSALVFLSLLELGNHFPGNVHVSIAQRGKGFLEKVWQGAQSVLTSPPAFV